MNYKSERAKATDIPKKVKDEVYQRDSQNVGEGVCIICLGGNGVPNAHYIRRSQGGLGIPENIGTLCIYCHNSFDFGYGEVKRRIDKRFSDYLKSCYPNWNKDDLIYKSK